MRREEGAEPTFLLVLDTFEEAEYATHDQLRALDELVSALAGAWPRLSVLVLGRASGEGMELAQQAVVSQLLGPLDDPATDGYLEHLGIEDPEDRAVLVRLARGNPLTLRIGARYRADYPEDDLAGDLEGLQAEMLRGVLYGRILDHIHDEEVGELAHPGLILHRITPQVLRKVLAPRCGLPDLSAAHAQELFEAFAREVFLVERADRGRVLLHRPELRRIMLRLLERDRPGDVTVIDKAAVGYWRNEPGNEARAEEIYHRLRLGQPTEALDERWIPGLEHVLGVDARDEIPEASRTWLARRAASGPRPQLRDVDAHGAAVRAGPAAR